MWNAVFLLLDIAIVIGLLLLAIISLFRQGYKNSLNRLFASLSIAAAVWIMANDQSQNIDIPSHISIFFNYAAYSFGLITSIFLLLIITRLAGAHKFKRLVDISLLPLIIVCIICVTPLVVGGVVPQGNTYGIIWGPLVWLFSISLLYTFGLISYEIRYGLRHAKGTKRRQLVSISIGLLIAIPPILLFSFFIPLLTGAFWVIRFGTTPAVVVVFSVYYSVIRYHLLDIRLAAVRTLTYVLSLTVLVTIYYTTAIIISNIFTDTNLAISQSPLSISMQVGLLLLFQPVKTFFDKITSKLFYRDYYEIDEFFTRFNRILSSTTDLRTLLEQATNEIATTIKSEQAFFFIHTSEDHFITAGTKNHIQLSKNDIMQLQNVRGKKNEIIIATLLDEDDPVHKLMFRHGLELILPLTQSDIVGYLCLGRHRTSHYTARDIKMLSTIADELVIAIQNTMSIEDVRTSNLMLRQIDKVKDEFVSVASHELRTPMTVIRGYINLLQREQLGPVNDEQQEILGKMSHNVKTLIDLVNDMLDLSKLEANKLEVQISDNSVNDLIDKAFEKIRVLYDGKGITLEYKGSDVNIKTDPEKFERIVLNLLSNAYKFTPTGGKVTVSSTIDHIEKIITICVADTGVGIPAESLDSLFRKFSQVENYLQRQTGGTGLGLAICKQLVNRLGGIIWVKSTIGTGSQFYFTMPIASNNDTDTVS